MQTRAQTQVFQHARTSAHSTSSLSGAARSGQRSPSIYGSGTRNGNERILVLDGGPFVLPEHVQNLPVLGLGAGDPRKDHQPQKEVWGLAWNTSDPVGFPGLAYCVGGRSVFWGGWSPRLLPSELPNSVWPQAVLDDMTPKNCRMDAKDTSVNPVIRLVLRRRTTSFLVTCTAHCGSNCWTDSRPFPTR